MKSLNTTCETTTPSSAAAIYTDNADYRVVGIAAAMLADDVERVTGTRPLLATASSLKKVQCRAAVVADTIGHSRIIDELVRKGLATMLMGDFYYKRREKLAIFLYFLK